MNKLTKWLLAGTLGLASALSTITGCSEKPQLQTLEEKIGHKNITRIEKTNSESNDRYIILIRQKHTHFYLENPEYKEKNVRELETTNQVQENIYNILNRLKENARIKEVYAEGYTEDSSTSELQKYAVSPFKEYPYLRGGETKLAAEGKIKIKPSESLVNYDIMDFNKRERTAIELIGKDKPQIAVLVYGAAHEFKDDVERWNAEHPEAKYSLIVITPEGIE